MLLISPYILFYGRYVRNESFVGLWGVLTFWLMLRYLEKGENWVLYSLAAVTAFNFATKETAFIYAAQALVFLGLYLVNRLTKQSWANEKDRLYFLVTFLASVLLAGGAGILFLQNRRSAIGEPASNAPPSTSSQNLYPLPEAGAANTFALILGALGLLAVLAAIFFLIRGYSLKRLRKERSFGLLIVLFTTTLPQLAPFPVRFLGWKIPVNATQVIAMTSEDVFRIAAMVLLMFILAIALGYLWDFRRWLISFAIYYAIFIVLYTSVFTNGPGFVTGLVGSLGYWLEQQGVNRGSQPSYFYWLIQIPIYEFLAAFGSLLALGIVIYRWIAGGQAKKTSPDDPQAKISPLETEANEILEDGSVGTGQLPEMIEEEAPVVPLLGFWSVTSLLAYTMAGEKMPWLTFHITLPMILLSGWAFGQLIDSINWTAFKDRRGWLILILIPVLLLSSLAVFGSLLGANPPFQGKDLESLKSTSTFITSFLVCVGSAIALIYLIKPWPIGQFVRVLALFFFALLGVLTARAAYRSSYINFDDATEFLVYAHSSGGVKSALEQIEDISERTTGENNVVVAYDDQTTYPYWWYLRNYPNQRYYGANPTRSLREAAAILVGDTNYGKIEPVVANAYNQFDYIRLWWPNQDYFGLTWERVLSALRDPLMREALFQIWLNRDYTLYGQATNKDMSLTNWYPSARMRLYVRKDIASQIWNYGTAITEEEVIADPCEDKQIVIPADLVVGTAGIEPGQFQRPRGIAVAPDGSLYVADTNNHRIQHLARDGGAIHTWGSFADISKGEAPGGTFFEPWGIAVGPDGSVYVTDTWNHRVQKFSPEGEFVRMWGYFGQAEAPEGFWGPRGIVVDGEGRVFVTDTGNKRVVVFDADGNFITEFGEAGFAAGQFDEPVGIALDQEGRVYVADTWNQRIQVFTEGEDGTFLPEKSWDVAAWYGQSLENKPFLATDLNGNIYATDPEGYRVIQFGSQGECKAWWGDYGNGAETFGMTGAAAVDAQGGVWVTDTGNGRLMHFVLPNP
jgi:DNA-binding beta-propeller fold protein YncE